MSFLVDDDVPVDDVDKISLPAGDRLGVYNRQTAQEIKDFETKLQLVIDFLKYIEEVKPWCKTAGKTPGEVIGTCGYTAPGMTVILLLFDKLGIKNSNDFNRIMPTTTYNTSPLYVSHIINEVIGNLFDLSNYCPLTGTHQGVMGLIKESMITKKSKKVMLLESEYEVMDGEIGGWSTYNNLQNGPNLLSFSTRGQTESDLCTFHHAVVYRQNNKCYVIDSWSAERGRIYRTSSYRQFTTEKVLVSLGQLITTTDTKLTREIMGDIFMAYRRFIEEADLLVTIHITKNEYIEELFQQVKERQFNDKNEFTSYFGGKQLGARKRTPTKKRKNRKVTKQKYKSYKNKRR